MSEVPPPRFYWIKLTPAEKQAFAPPTGVWVAFNWDGSAFVPFATELEALRHASSYHMPVKFVEFGDDEWMRK